MTVFYSTRNEICDPLADADFPLVAYRPRFLDCVNRVRILADCSSDENRREAHDSPLLNQKREL